MRILAIILCYAVSSACFAQVPQLSPNAPEDKPQSVQANKLSVLNAALAPYVAEARKTYPAAKARFLQGLPRGEHFFVTTRLYDNAGNFEQVFIAVHAIKNGTVYGVIASDIMAVSGYKLGDYYSFPESRILDWLITHPDGTEEGNVVGKFLDTYGKNGA